MSTGPLAYLFTGSLRPLTYSLVTPCLHRLRAPPRLFVHLLAHSLPSLWESKWLMLNNQAVLDHSVVLFLCGWHMSIKTFELNLSKISIDCRVFADLALLIGMLWCQIFIIQWYFLLITHTRRTKRSIANTLFLCLFMWIEKKMLESGNYVHISEWYCFEWCAT